MYSSGTKGVKPFVRELQIVRELVNAAGLGDVLQRRRLYLIDSECAHHITRRARKSAETPLAVPFEGMAHG